MSLRSLGISLAALLSLSCDALMTSPPNPEDTLAEPIEELTTTQLQLHLQGDEQFAKVFTAAEGLGPVFVSTSCQSCHVGDGKGHALTTLTRFGRYDGEIWNALEHLGGPQLQSRALPGFDPEVIPAEATGVARFMPPAVSGLGYLEAVTDDEILRYADPDDRDGDGISGRVHLIDPPEYFLLRPGRSLIDGRAIGRFGFKAASVDLLHQTAKAYREDMGVTSDFEMLDVPRHASDLVADPEASAAIVQSVVFYLRTLKTPPRRGQTSPGVLRGEQLFADAGCTSCHRPSIVTGPSDIAAISNREIHPYTDVLLHDMGPELDDGYTEGAAETREWRTTPLWGIGLASHSQGGTPRYLHDGRASSLREAIRFHGGEAAASRDRFNAMSSHEQEALLEFLESL